MNQVNQNLCETCGKELQNGLCAGCGKQPNECDCASEEKSE